MLKRLICGALVLCATSLSSADWVVSDTRTWGTMPLDGQTGTVAATGHLTVTSVSTVEDGGELIIDGTLDYNGRRFNMNDGAITVRGGTASFDCPDTIMVCDDYGPSYINVLGGVMWAQAIETRMAYRGGLITVGGGTLRIEQVEPDSSVRDPWQWLWDGILVPDEANGYTEIVIKPWGDSGAEVTAILTRRVLQIGTATVTVDQKDLNLKMGTYSHVGDVSGNKVCFAHGPDCDYTWDIKCLDLETGERNFYKSGNGNRGKTLDVYPRIDGDIIVWAGGPLWSQAGGVWGHEPLNLGIISANIATGAQKPLREYTMSESYSHPAVSGSKVIWVEHLDLDTRPLGSSQANNWYNTPYNICGADITSLGNPVYFTIATNVGNHDPYGGDFDDVIDISGNIVVWEGAGDIYGADISSPYDIRVFPICTDPARQLDPAISGNLVVWTDERNDSGDIYGAYVLDPDNIQVLEIVREDDAQRQPAVSGRTIVYVEAPDDFSGGEINVCQLTMQHGALHIPLEPSQHGMGPAIDGSVIIWQDDYYGKAQGISLEIAYTIADGAVENLTAGKRYDCIQDAIDQAASGDQIVVGPGVYHENIDFQGKNLLIKSTNPSDANVVANTVINGGTTGPVVTFANGETLNCVLNGFTIAGGNIGVYCKGSSPTITSCTVGEPGAIAIELSGDSAPAISNCTILGIIAKRGIVENRSTGRTYDYIQATIDQAAPGDQIVVSPGTYHENINLLGKNLLVTSTDPSDSTVVANTIISGDSWNPVVTFANAEKMNCVLAGFTISGGSSGIHCSGYGTVPKVTNCLVTANKGPGIEVVERGGLVVENSIIAENQADGIDCSYSRVEITNCTVTANQGAGIKSSYTGRRTITNCIIWNNSGPAIERTEDGITVVTCSDAEGGFPGEGNIDADPCFADPANGDYHLQSQAGRWDPHSQTWIRDEVTSPCIDGGDPDQDCKVELWPHGKRINMGAYGGMPQASMSLSNMGNRADLDNDDSINSKDFAHLAGSWQTKAVLLAEDLNRNGIVDFGDVALLADEWLWEQ